MQTVVRTPPNCDFDRHLHVELVVRPDGTAMPKFIYKARRSEDESIAVSGTPFYVDTTYAQRGGDAKTYIGIDFGTSNTAVSFIDPDRVQLLARHSGESPSDVLASLPYPLFAPLAAYLSEHDTSLLVKKARAFIEAALAIAAYLAYGELCSKQCTGNSKLFNRFTQRSAGPLWKLLQDCLTQLGDKSEITAPYQELLTREHKDVIDSAVLFVAREKHEKADAGRADLYGPIQILANVSRRVFTRNVFGYFEGVKRVRFARGREYTGIFRQAHGSLPFVKVLEYSGQEDFPDLEPFVINVVTGSALSLHPFIFWDRCQKHPDLHPGHCYIYDIPLRQGGFSFKAVDSSCTCEVNPESNSQLAELLAKYREKDLQIGLLQIGSLKEVPEG
jgi:hypothetical protein